MPVQIEGNATTQANSGLLKSRFRTTGLLTLITSGLPVTREKPRRALDYPGKLFPGPTLSDYRIWGKGISVHQSPVDRFAN